LAKKRDIININIEKLKPNEDNPRTIKNDRFEKLCQSIKEFPEMLNIRPIVADNDFKILGGNMRFQACKVLEFKKVPVIIVDDFNESQINQFVIKDNVSHGDWDYDSLGNDWDAQSLDDWGLNVWTNNDIEEIDEKPLNICESCGQKIRK
jgi:ParB-like chromosome segregation protein Spo0J|tara:strand:- start:139 stop:588 length:450 start_codon:yes stop_codon:yes gene_type:complete